MEDNLFHEAATAWKQYYDITEAIDRGFPHAPARHPRGGVIPVGGYRSQADAIRKQRKEVLQKMRGLGVPVHLERKARHEGMWLHEQELKPCDCEDCTYHRNVF